MARELVAGEAEAALERAFASMQLRKAVERRNPKRKPPTSITSARLRGLVDGFQRRVDAGNYADVTAGDLVACYAWGHTRTYGGVMPEELCERGAWRKALLSAGRMLEHEFKGDGTAMLDYLRWTWGREIAREEWRKQNAGGNGGRVTWYEQFVKRRLLTDYLVRTGRVSK